MRSPARMRRDVVPMLALCALAHTSCAGARGGASPLARAEAAVAEVGLLHEGPDTLLDVTITVHGRAAREAVGVRLDSWGGSDRRQVFAAIVDGTPTAVDADGMIRFASRRGSGHVVRYRLRVHPEQRSSEWRLVPHRADDAVVFFTRNVVPVLALTGGREQFIEVMRLAPPPGFAAVTGMGDCATVGCRRVPGNGVAVFLPRTSPHLPLLASATARILDLSRQGFGPAMGALVDRVVRERPLQPATPAPGASRLLVVERTFEDGVYYGTWTEQGIVLGLTGAPPLDLGHRKTIAHELLHESVNPARLGADAPLWMYEGFAEYLAAWTLAATGEESPVEFAARMRQHEIRATMHVVRDGARFGEREGAARRGSADDSHAYSGGTLVAFALDAALRACGADLATVVAEASAARSRAGTEAAPSSAATAFRDALAARGLASLHDSLVAAGQVPRIAPALAAAGFLVERNATSLTYLGFALADERSLLSTGARVVSDVDPDGPAAVAGLRRGDTIVVVEAPTRGDPPWIGPAVDRRHGAGLAEIASGATSVRIRVQRTEGARDLLVRPRLIPGGYREVARAPTSGTMAFFRPPVAAGASCPR